MADSLGQAIKKQIAAILDALKTQGYISSWVAQDQNPNAITQDPPSGYPFAIIGMPRIANDFEDQATNIRVYRYDILFVMSYEGLADVANSVEGVMDAALNLFDTNFTLAGSAIAATVPPARIEPMPITIADKTYTTFIVSIEARTLYTVGS
jgi:hypothetical protein